MRFTSLANCQVHQNHVSYCTDVTTFNFIFRIIITKRLSIAFDGPVALLCLK